MPSFIFDLKKVDSVHKSLSVQSDLIRCDRPFKGRSRCISLDQEQVCTDRTASSEMYFCPVGGSDTLRM